MSISNGIMQLISPLKHKHGTSKALASSSYVPAAGEILVATDTGELKGGNGTQTWKQLPSYNDRIDTAENSIDVLDKRTSIIANSYKAGLHNTYMRGKNLGTTVTAAQYAAIRTGTFDDLWIGDYWTVSSGGVGYTCRIVDINYYSFVQGGGDGNMATDPLTGVTRVYTGEVSYPTRHGADGYCRVFRNHIIVSVEQLARSLERPGSAEDKNEDGTFVGYTKSYYYRHWRPMYLSAAIALFGNEHVLEWQDMCPTGYTSEGKPKGWAKYIQRCELPWAEQESGVVNYNINYSQVGPYLNGQFAYFRLRRPYCAGTRVYRDITGANANELICLGNGSNTDRARLMPMQTVYQKSVWQSFCNSIVMIGSLSAADDSVRSPEPTEEEEE